MRTSHTPRSSRPSFSQKLALSIAGGATIALAGFGGLAIANAQDASTATPPAGSSAPAEPGNHQAHEAQRAAALASALGVDQQKVTDALTQIHTEMRGDQSQGQQKQTRTDLAQRLANKLGLDETKVAAALQSTAPQGGQHAGHKGGPREGLNDPARSAALAQALGVDQQRLTNALTAIHEQRESAKADGTSGTKPDRAAMKTQFAADLATALGLDQSTVEHALSATLHADQPASSPASSAA